MLDIKQARTPTSAATAIVQAIRVGELDQARALFRAAIAAGRPLDDLIMDVAAATEPGPGEITVGEGALVFGNPLRKAVSWGSAPACRPTGRAGGFLCPGWATRRRGVPPNAARRHSDEDHAGAVTSVIISTERN